MRRIIGGLFIAVVLILVFFRFAGAQDVEWQTSYDEALKTAVSENKPVMIDFYTGWCGWCKKLDKETYRNKEVVELSKNFVCLKIDAEKESQLAYRYAVRGFPTVIFTDVSGTVIGGGAGYRNADMMASEMKSALAKFSGSRSRAA